MKEALPRPLFHRKFKVIIIQKPIIILKIFKMKKYIFLFFMLVGSVLISCEKDDHDDHDDHDGHDHSMNIDFTKENDADYYA
tara:strand:+ start:1306 stop:1551 length:246 start_codon:yes stop_codon:yes gene_type:complete